MVNREQVAGREPSDQGNRPNTPAVRPSWRDVMLGIAGACKVRNVLPSEAAAIGDWMAALEHDLAEPAGPADIARLGRIGRAALEEMRLSRDVFQRGTTSQRSGEVRGVVSEWRAFMRLGDDLLGRLKFRSTKAALPLSAYLSKRSEAPESTIADAAPSVPPRRTERATAPATHSEAATLDVDVDPLSSSADGAPRGHEVNGAPSGEGRRGGGGSGVEPSPTTSAASQSVEPPKAAPNSLDEQASTLHRRGVWR